MPHDVFISYSHQDEAVADSICAALEAAKIPCWIAHRDVSPGESWDDEIVNAIEASRMAVVVLTDHANESRFVRTEVFHAFKRGLPILPLRLGGVEINKGLTLYLGQSHWLDASIPLLDIHLARLARAAAKLLSNPSKLDPALSASKEFGGRVPHAPPPPAIRPRTVGREKWRFETGGMIRSNPTIGADGTIYFGSDDYCVYAVNPDGTAKWRRPYKTGGQVWSSPAIGPDGTIYVGSWDKRLHAISSGGSPKWREPCYIGSQVFSSAVVANDGNVFIVSRGAMVAVAADGSQCMRAEFDPDRASELSAFTGLGGRILAFSIGGLLFEFKVNPEGLNCEPFGNASVPEGLPDFSRPAVGRSGKLFVVSKTALVHTFSSWGAQIARVKLDTERLCSNPALGKRGAVFVGSSDGWLHEATSSNTPRSRRLFQADGPIVEAPVLDGDTIYFASCSGSVYAVDQGGKAVWKRPFKTGGEIRTRPVIGRDGAVYIGCDDGFLYAIG